ncbi:hypothetical protein P7C73_g5854, partial [Tremellales sp. Uapishka_1]
MDEDKGSYVETRKEEKIPGTGTSTRRWREQIEDGKVKEGKAGHCAKGGEGKDKLGKRKEGMREQGKVEKMNIECGEEADPMKKEKQDVSLTRVLHHYVTPGSSPMAPGQETRPKSPRVDNPTRPLEKKKNEGFTVPVGSASNGDDLARVYGSVLDPKLQHPKCTVCLVDIKQGSKIYLAPSVPIVRMAKHLLIRGSSRHNRPKALEAEDPLCKACYTSVFALGECFSCMNPIIGDRDEGFSGKHVNGRMGKKWHARCFRCVGCERNLFPPVDGAHSLLLSGRPSCTECFDSLSTNKSKARLEHTGTDKDKPLPSAPTNVRKYGRPGEVLSKAAQEAKKDMVVQFAKIAKIPPPVEKVAVPPSVKIAKIPPLVGKVAIPPPVEALEAKSVHPIRTPSRTPEVRMLSHAEKLEMEFGKFARIQEMVELPPPARKLAVSKTGPPSFTSEPDGIDKLAITTGPRPQRPATFDHHPVIATLTPKSPCDECGNIVGIEFAVIGSRAYHFSCLPCAGCGRRLVPQRDDPCLSASSVGPSATSTIITTPVTPEKPTFVPVQLPTRFGGMKPCPGCDIKVAPMERDTVQGPGAAIWHKKCLRCSNERCRKFLDGSAKMEENDKPWCRACSSDEDASTPNDRSCYLAKDRDYYHSKNRGLGLAKDGDSRSTAEHESYRPAKIGEQYVVAENGDDWVTKNGDDRGTENGDRLVADNNGNPRSAEDRDYNVQEGRSHDVRCEEAVEPHIGQAKIAFGTDVTGGGERLGSGGFDEVPFATRSPYPRTPAIFPRWAANNTTLLAVLSLHRPLATTTNRIHEMDYELLTDDFNAGNSLASHDNLASAQNVELEHQALDLGGAEGEGDVEYHEPEDASDKKGAKGLRPEEKKERQKLQNRKAAERSRNKKREELTSLELTVANIQEENNRLKAHLATLLVSKQPTSSQSPRPATDADGIDYTSLGKLQAELKVAKERLLMRELQLASLSANPGEAGTEQRKELMEKEAVLGKMGGEARSLLAVIEHLREEKQALGLRRKIVERELEARRTLGGMVDQAVLDGGEKRALGVERALLDLRGWIDGAVKNWEQTSILSPGQREKESEV